MGQDLKTSATADDEWLEALALEDLWEGEMIGVRLANGCDILLVKLAQDEVHAYDNRCPHAGARLSEGRLSATQLRCSAHLWEFDLRTGHGVNPRSCRLQRFAVKVVGAKLWVRIRP